MVEIWRDGQGYVYADENQIEHYSKELTEQDRDYLSKKVKHLMSLGVPVHSGTVAWFSSWFEGVEPGAKYLGILKHTPNVYANENEIAFQLGRNELYVKCLIWSKTWNRFYATWFPHDSYEAPYHVMLRHGFQMAQAGQNEWNGPCYANHQQMARLLRSYKVPDVEIPEPYLRELK